MIVGCVRLMWWLLKPARVLTRLLIYLLIITIPIWGLSFMVGIVDGIVLSHLRFQYNDHASKRFLLEMEMAQWRRSFEVPGAPMDKWAPGPFYVPQLKQPLCWWNTFGLARHFGTSSMVDMTKLSPIASPYGLYRNLNETKEDPGEWHHWIYASPTSTFFDPLSDDWDIAFNDLLQYHAATPAAHNASFHVLTCGLSWLCDMWRIKGPALIHMTNEQPTEYFDFSKDDSSTSFNYQHGIFYWDDFPEFDGYEKITLRVAELPFLDQTAYPYILPRGQFPSRFEQLRSITSNERLWQELPYLTEWEQILSITDEYTWELEKTHKQTYGRLLRCTSSVNELFGLDGSDVDSLFKLVGLLFGTTFSHYGILWYRKLFAYGHYPEAKTKQEIAMAIVKYEMDKQPNLMESMLNEFLLQLPDDMKRTMAENEEVLDILGRMRNMTRYGATE